MTGSEDTRNWWQRWSDRWAVSGHGGLRVRILWRGEQLVAVVTGRSPGPPPERLRRHVLELNPRGPGTIDLELSPGGSWKIRTRGELADPRLEQRLRNVLGNL